MSPSSLQGSRHCLLFHGALEGFIAKQIADLKLSEVRPLGINIEVMVSVLYVNGKSNMEVSFTPPAELRRRAELINRRSNQYYL